MQGEDGRQAMTGDERRAAIRRTLAAAQAPVSATALGQQLGVSRQVIVQDIALLRSSGVDVQATNRGYLLQPAAPQRPVRLLKVRHSSAQIREELYAVVDCGGCVEDVMVNHRTYGRMSAPLKIATRRDAERFLDELASGVSSPLSAITDGYHFHHISAATEEQLDEIEAALAAAGFTAPLTPYEEGAL